MSKTFTFSKLSKLGGFDPKWGQAYWGETNEQLEPVKFNSMNQNITEGDKIEVEDILLKTSSKGIEYHQLKKVKVVGATVTRPSDNNIAAQLNRIEAKLDKLLGVDEELDQQTLEEIPNG